MSEHILHKKVWINRPLDEVFDFFSRAGNLERITPPLLNFRILTPEPIEMRPGTLIDYALRVRGLPMRWRTKITVWNPPYEFADVQLKGPYKLWHHTHTFREVDGGTEMTDVVRYELPLGPLGDLVHNLIVRRDVESIFNFRTQQMGALLGSTRPLPDPQ